MISKKYYSCVQSITKVSERILSVSLNGNPQVTVTVVYAPTELDDKEVKDQS
jgi:hypothetical protein